MPWRTQLQPLHVKPPSPPVRVERYVFRIASVSARDTEEHNIWFALAVAYVIPVCAECGELETDDGWLGGSADLDRELLRVDATFGDAVVGVAARHDLHAAAHVVALEFFVGDDVAVVAELVRVVRGEVFGAKLVVRHCELGRCEFSDVAGKRSVWVKGIVSEYLPFVLVRTPNVSSAPAGVDQLPLAVVDANCVPCMV